MTAFIPTMDELDTAHAGAGSTTAPPSQAVAPDPVTRFLQARGLSTETAYLGDSEFELGKRVRVAPLDLIYRFEQGRLLICEIAATHATFDHVGAIRVLVSLIHAVERAVPEVRVVEGLVPVKESGDGEAALGRRLVAVYRQLGAQCDEDDVAGMVQVRYMMQGGAGEARPARA